jgi:hypothetical protein
MKSLLALSFTALAACGCATTYDSTYDSQYASNDCKVAPVVTTGPGASSRVTDLDRRYAEMQLATSDYRLRNLQRNPAYATNNLEQSLQDCARR